MGEERRACDISRHAVGIDDEKHLDGLYQQAGGHAVERFKGKCLPFW